MGAAQLNLGTALCALGTREGGTVRLEEAVATYRAVHEERMRERVPLEWAAVQHNLGAALCVLGMREGGTARLEEGQAAYRAALEEWTRERVPLEWATAQYNLGVTLQMLKMRESSTARLEEAVAAFDNCLSVFASAGSEEWVQDARSRRGKAQAEIASRSPRKNACA